jgi:hypothetical protein
MAGLGCGVLDIMAALVVYGSMGLKPLRLLQGIAAGVLGPKSFQGGMATALLGLALHFVIAFGAATLYFAVSRSMRILVEQAALCGALRRRRLLLHEPDCRAPLWGSKVPVLHEDDGDRDSDPRLLCGLAHCAEHTPFWELKLRRMRLVAAVQ